MPVRSSASAVLELSDALLQEPRFREGLTPFARVAWDQPCRTGGLAL